MCIKLVSLKINTYTCFCVLFFSMVLLNHKCFLILLGVRASLHMIRRSHSNKQLTPSDSYSRENEKYIIIIYNNI